MSDAPRTKNDIRYFSLDFWRGIACLMIVLFHSSFYVLENPKYEMGAGLGGKIFQILNHCDSGVPMFFVISGYCITAACQGTKRRRQPLKQYFFRRFRRIFPPFWAATALLALCTLVALWLGVPEWYHDNIHPQHSVASLSAWNWWGNLSLTEIWRPHVLGDKTWFLLGPSWSLNYEEQFYAVCGLLLLLPRLGFFWGALGVTAVVLTLGMIRGLGYALPIDGFFFDGFWLMFASGILVYYQIHLATKYKKWIPVFFVFAIVVGLGWKFYRDSNQEITYLFFALLLMLLHPWDLKIATSRWARPVTYCGIMCYSLYLVHWIFVKPIAHLLYFGGVQGYWPTLFVVLPIALAVSLAAGWTFHLYVERRFLNTPPVMPWEVAQVAADKHDPRHAAAPAPTPAKL